jgi:hypothetical protein
MKLNDTHVHSLIPDTGNILLVPLSWILPKRPTFNFDELQDIFEQHVNFTTDQLTAYNALKLPADPSILE